MTTSACGRTGRSYAPYGHRPVPTARFVTWNIQRGRREGGDPDPDALLATCASFEADVLAVQELFRAAPGTSDDLLLRLADATGLTPVDGPAVEVGGGTYGNALLVRGPAEEVRCHHLPPSADPRERRAVVRCRWRGATVACCHLDHRGEAAVQLGAVLARVAGEGPAVVLGDLNLRPRGVRAVLAEVDGGWVALDAPAAFPAHRPNRAIDHVLLRGIPPAVPRPTSQPPVSDHRPVLVELAWPTR
jgi:endonuclease/exonuclease/phosphatase family metal-dependent hydrolase